MEDEENNIGCVLIHLGASQGGERTKERGRLFICGKRKGKGRGKEKEKGGKKGGG